MSQPIVIPLAGVIGAEVRGVSLTEAPGTGTRALVEDALERHGVLIFRDQHITPAQQAAFSCAFGNLAISPRVDGRVDGHPEVFAVGNTGAHPILFSPREPDGDLEWHSDQMHRPVPARASLLCARIVPARGGDTLFACTFSAYAALDPRLQRECDGLTAIHSPNGLRAYLGDEGQSGADASVYEQSPEPDVAWPLVRCHPRSGRPALYFGSHVTVGIAGWPRERARALIRRLTEHTAQACFGYRHRWRVGDALLWDNRRVLHAGTYYDVARYRRLLHRTILTEDRLPTGVTG